MPNSFSEWLPEVAADPVLLSPGDLNSEAQANLWTFALTPEEAAVIPQSEVEKFLLEIINSRGKHLLNRKVQPKSVVFYCWHDEQASQLRFSLVSKSHGRLPFGCRVKEVSNPSSIVRSFLQSPYHGGIPRDELQPVLEGGEAEGKVIEPEDWEVEVWSVLLP